ncbi:MAG: peptidoglycan DD-metalloendopeptidase family protein [Paracoccus sp. (in: a-proteobacteria)]|uniref:murein hydrolase activator EnvC family protein n=1 Tax=Paracoccus sp. TaxID=267 RepID=UPI0026E04CDB|nr:peptidoglycan DD-metalloendopeptidase family protein [Paracoccus sp. (in: a-proteobacteria)]MDO5622841.1 peptidoglycan DD-metalloendopeptidase family protein [Paracoccus sp. (in: a-proteobacteria)]
MRLSALFLAAVLALTPVARADEITDAGREAAAAAQQLRDAIAQIDTALTADDQVVALTRMIRAYEQGLGALRDGLRRASIREAEIRAEFDARRDTLGRMLGVMVAMQRSPETTLLLHPSGPQATAESGMVMTSVAPALQAQAEAMRSRLEEISRVRALQEAAANTLAQGLGQAQEARRLLASAVSDRSHMPARFGSEPAEIEVLRASATSLEQFAQGIAGIEDDVGPPMADFEGAQGSLRMPVMGSVLRGYDQPDAAGVRRPGMVIATAPAALVTTPWPATIRYRGPLLDYGNVMIVEPARGYLLVFAGMAQVFGEVGDVLKSGEPIGLMGGTEAPAQEFGVNFIVNAAQGGDAGRTETLYVELRQGNNTLDPADWFVMNPIVEAATPEPQD